jgi:hypothetical protein
MSNYYEKYLKYKSKYLELKNQYGSASESKAVKEAEVNTCSICYENIENDGIILHCNHHFHRQCVLAAYNSQYHHIKCANCREQYNETDFTQLGINPAHVHEHVDPEVARRAAEDLADMELHFAANRGSMAAFDRIQNNRAIDEIISRYGSILGALRQYNESSGGRRKEEAKKAIIALLKHNPALANYIEPGSGRHILSFIDDFEMGIILINAGANRDYVDNAIRKPLSYIDRRLRKRIRTSGL